MKDFFKLMLSGISGLISSKRVCGVIGWIVVLAVFIYCAINNLETPSATDAILMSVVALLGVESVTNIFNKTNNTTND